MYWYNVGFKCVCKCMAQSIEYVATYDKLFYLWASRVRVLLCMLFFFSFLFFINFISLSFITLCFILFCFKSINIL